MICISAPVVNGLNAEHDPGGRQALRGFFLSALPLSRHRRFDEGQRICSDNGIICLYAEQVKTVFLGGRGTTASTCLRIAPAYGGVSGVPPS